MAWRMRVLDPDDGRLVRWQRMATCELGRMWITNTEHRWIIEGSRFCCWACPDGACHKAETDERSAAWEAWLAQKQREAEGADR